MLQLIESDARECGTHLALQVARARDLVEREGGRFFPAEEDRQELRERLGVRRAEAKARAGAIVAGELVSTKTHRAGEHRRLTAAPGVLTRQRERMGRREGRRVRHGWRIDSQRAGRSYGMVIAEG